MLFSKTTSQKNARKSLKTAKDWLSYPYDKITQEKVKSLIEKGGEELIESFIKNWILAQEV